ncbi:hypothetical protein BDZ97DRAFT_2082274 [Flammula alnicola]|nr:hypothetical protein BDZ97DRAFT_2082274 [Flammula alnicola]
MPRGRKPGTKNSPDAGNVGRPRKDGQPPQKKQHTAASTPNDSQASSSHSSSNTGPTPSSSSGTLTTSQPGLRQSTLSFSVVEKGSKKGENAGKSRRADVPGSILPENGSSNHGSQGRSTGLDGDRPGSCENQTVPMGIAREENMDAEMLEGRDSEPAAVRDGQDNCVDIDIGSGRPVGATTPTLASNSQTTTTHEQYREKQDARKEGNAGNACHAGAQEPTLHENKPSSQASQARSAPSTDNTLDVHEQQTQAMGNVSDGDMDMERLEGDLRSAVAEDGQEINHVDIEEEQRLVGVTMPPPEAAAASTVEGCLNVKRSGNGNGQMGEVNIHSNIDITENRYGSDISAYPAELDDDDLSEEFRSIGDDNDDPDPPPNKKTRSTMPTWLASKYQLIRDQVTTEISKTKQPACYRQGTFYMSDQNVLLSQRGVLDIEPSVFHRKPWFVWLPHCLLGDRIPCPDCRSSHRKSSNGGPVFLQSLGWNDKARRVVGIDSNIFIAGYRYRCVLCRHTYRSWSPAILDVLPKSLAAQFTFQLSFRSGLTDQLATLLRDSLRSGIGPEQFTQIIQAFHYRRYDKLHLEYLQMIDERKNGIYGSLKTKCQPFGAFRDRDGYAGFIPGLAYFGGFYDKMVETAAPEMRQLIAMTTARILQVDHSFKTVKRTARVGGVPIFSALHSTVNEYGEIRAMVLTPTKAHDQFMPVLAAIPRSLAMFGHGEVEAVYTDNVRGDKSELEITLPSLTKAVVPVVKTSLPLLELPSSWSKVELSTPHQINMRFDIIMNHKTPSTTVTAAVDMEWPVDTHTGIHGPVALIQIAYQSVVYLIPTYPFLHEGHLNLPHSLITFLRSSVYTKVGVGIGADFKKLHSNCGYSAGDPQFSGYIELGSMAYDHHAAKRRNTSLSDLTTTLLRHSLNKDPAIRVTPRWADKDLPQSFIDYAVLDAYALWKIYTTLDSLAAPLSIHSESPGKDA